MRAVTGTGDGNVLLWRNVAPDAPENCTMQVIRRLTYRDEKVKTAKLLSAHTLNCSAVRVRVKRDAQNNFVTDILSGGSGGWLQVWRQESKDNFKRRDKSSGNECVQLPAESSTARPPRIKAIDFFPGTGEFIVGTDESDIWQVNPKDVRDPTGPAGKDCVLMVKGHRDMVDALAAHPTQPGLFATGSHGDHVYLWNAQKFELVGKRALKGYQVSAVAFNPAGDRLAVGTLQGKVFLLVLDAENPDPKGNPLYRLRLTGQQDTAMPAIADSFQRIPMLSFSPDGRVLAVASADQCIYLYAADGDAYGLTRTGDLLSPRRGTRYLAKCSGHSSTVKHLDWSTDSRVLQSNDQSYELLYWQADRLSPGLGMQVLHDQRDTQWATWSTINGFDVMGMFPKGTDNTDINKTARSHHAEGARFVAAATDFGAPLPPCTRPCTPALGTARPRPPPCTPLHPPCLFAHTLTPPHTRARIAPCRRRSALQLPGRRVGRALLLLRGPLLARVQRQVAHPVQGPLQGRPRPGQGHRPAARPDAAHQRGRRRPLHLPVATGPQGGARDASRARRRRARRARRARGAAAAAAGRGGDPQPVLPAAAGEAARAGGEALHPGAADRPAQGAARRARASPDGRSAAGDLRPRDRCRDHLRVHARWSPSTFQTVPCIYTPTSEKPDQAKSHALRCAHKRGPPGNDSVS